MLSKTTHKTIERKFLSVTPDQLRRLRVASRDPDVWRELGIDLDDTSIVVVEQDRVRIVRDRAA